MGTEADYLIDQHFDRKHGEYGDELPPVRSKPLLCGKSWTCRHKNYQTNECRYEGTCAAKTHNASLYRTAASAGTVGGVVGES